MRRRWLLLLIAVVAPATAAVGGAAAVALVSTPGVTSAPERVAAGLARYGAPSDGGRVPDKVGRAVLATEDSRFWSNPGVDVRGAARAAWGFAVDDPNYGGATIEIQLAKLLYTPGRSDAVALAEQLALALKLDHHFAKRAILAMYLDAAYFGDGAYGITAAAGHYFGAGPDALTWGQAALLAGLVQSPSRFDPHHHLHAALQRRDQVLARMVAVGVLTAGQAAAVAAEPLRPAVPFGG